MKKLILIASLFLTTTAFSTDERYKYEIAIEHVTDYPSAKMVTDILRETFGTSPRFNDDSDKFVIESDTLIIESDLSAILSANSHNLINYKKTDL